MTVEKSAREALKAIGEQLLKQYDKNVFYDENGKFDYAKASEKVHSIARLRTGPKEEMFYLWRDNQWQVIPTKKLLRSLLCEFDVTNHYKREFVSNLVQKMDTMSPSCDVIPLEDKVYVPHDDEVREISPGYENTFVIPAAWDSDLHEMSTEDLLDETDYLEDFLDEVPVDAEKLQMVAGDCLTPEQLWDNIYFLFGEGHTGKSAFMNILRAMLGDDNVASVDMGRLSGRFGQIELMDKLANLADEASSEDVDADKIKQMTSDSLMAEPKGKSMVQFDNGVTTVFASNELPELPDDSGTTRRATVLHFDRQVPKDKARSFKQKHKKSIEEIIIEEELDYFFYWSLKGLKKLNDEAGVVTDRDADEMHMTFFQHGRPAGVEAFVEKRVINEAAVRHKLDDGDKPLSVDREELYSAYRRFCNEYRFEPFPRGEFTGKVKYLTGCQRSDYEYINITLKDKLQVTLDGAT